MQVEETALEGVRIVHLDVFADERGSFAETFDSGSFSKLGIDTVFVQDSWSHSARAGVVRGLHFQLPPHAQTKIVRVIRGKVFDVIVDLRAGSPTFSQHISFELSADDPKCVLIPGGFAHGFCTLEDNSEVTYKMSDHYTPDLYKGLLWCDPELKINWPVSPDDALVSQKDANHPGLAELPRTF
ncbi:MAG: dTDP-4-dehydrorhamnose 3,5-epimerase [Alphaproteobacteria bacterium]|jgi:dTDP-4-dehydrorhamnose 3,5-epimerase|nr:dTDP-4-dehydrorhamnose 3,5-epimerase [Alphaproteobacteria bacterium]MBT4083636.1 dTDP-4-dehydrorhamnose 3,5-epimerase [Alphaproteobacteria bacterium]MBT4545158.1 dTDP-4-dehydrorhamnose 3,5-epimerase [Alphaproteobacteria bacterium]MBT6388179.1 dTDP-4-dehydrorhamnose 3,5-epimerase [Alphaproteobacteria bacterium]MBT7747919.1 dTDP-4-dehydrorhamnose 3,5-epimerase [Alphaproteobacteria bacterium]